MANVSAALGQPAKRRLRMRGLNLFSESNHLAGSCFPFAFATAEPESRPSRIALFVIAGRKPARTVIRSFQSCFPSSTRTYGYGGGRCHPYRDIRDSSDRNFHWNSENFRIGFHDLMDARKTGCSPSRQSYAILRVWPVPRCGDTVLPSFCESAVPCLAGSPFCAPFYVYVFIQPCLEMRRGAGVVAHGLTTWRDHRVGART